MALTHKDFLLSDAELDVINRHFAQCVKKYAQAGEEPASGVKVEFDWCRVLADLSLPILIVKPMDWIFQDFCQN